MNPALDEPIDISPKLLFVNSVVPIKRHHIRDKNTFETGRHAIESSNNAFSQVPTRAPREPRAPVGHQLESVRGRRVDTRAFGDPCRIDEAPWPDNRSA